MTERRQHRWFLTCRAVDLLYVADHQHPSPKEEARAAGLAAFNPDCELPKDYRERFALDHDHPAHLEGQGDSPFTAGDSPDQKGGGRCTLTDAGIISRNSETLAKCHPDTVLTIGSTSVARLG